ncbi:uncharacterized protein C2845_PM08G17100 [Panicum miliaceum]|uniref:KIB1-4 beta-propeller domain-containing protein n=1 Tax=Panicum miliaceum TaxID=4540 RepID=A0A3L6R4M7_PANMI|nr:uncharacterized protein C2845_PM08G17100 [Panicum miliaceum]
MEERGRSATPTPQPRTSPRAATARPSWRDVPDNILVRISAFLRCHADRVHMACASKLWSAAVRGLGRPPPPVLPPLPPLPPQLPWLIFPNTATPTFYSPIARRNHRLGRLPPDVRRARCCGSGDGGWLVLALDSRHSHALYNLNTSRRIALPPTFTTPADQDLPLVVRAATISAPPSGPDRYMVAAIVLVGNRSTAAFWSEGSESWFSTGALLDARPQDAIYHGGARAFFFVTSREDVVSFRPTYGSYRRLCQHLAVQIRRGQGPSAAAAWQWCATMGARMLRLLEPETFPSRAYSRVMGRDAILILTVHTRATSSSGPATEDQLERTDFASVAAEEPPTEFPMFFYLHVASLAQVFCGLWYIAMASCSHID